MDGTEDPGRTGEDTSAPDRAAEKVVDVPHNEESVAKTPSEPAPTQSTTTETTETRTEQVSEPAPTEDQSRQKPANESGEAQTSE